MAKIIIYFLQDGSKDLEIDGGVITTEGKKRTVVFEDDAKAEAFLNNAPGSLQDDGSGAGWVQVYCGDLSELVPSLVDAAISKYLNHETE